MEQRKCLCGCGETVLGDRKFKHNHWSKTEEGKRLFGRRNFKNARTDHGDGYKTMNVPGFGHVLEHRVVLGIHGTKLISHHLDGNRSNNDPSNLIIMPDTASHRLEHQRARALAACGYADWRKCARALAL